MAKGSEIIVTPNPRGVFVEGKVNGTPKPGTVMQYKAAAFTNNRPELEVYNRDADSNRPQGPLIVLLPKSLQGVDETTAYADGDWGYGYIPAPGEELNMLFANVSGTADDVAVGDILIIDDGTGKLINNTGSPEIEPFMSLEDYTDPDADKLLHVVYSGY